MWRAAGSSPRTCHTARRRCRSWPPSGSPPRPSLSSLCTWGWGWGEGSGRARGQCVWGLATRGEQGQPRGLGPLAQIKRWPPCYLNLEINAQSALPPCPLTAVLDGPVGGGVRGAVAHGNHCGRAGRGAGSGVRHRWGAQCTPATTTGGPSGALCMSPGYVPCTLHAPPCMADPALPWCLVGVPLPTSTPRTLPAPLHPLAWLV